ncbi:hypothetical protein CVT24_010111 [Panaeolus cyanescens]|uniref:Uncharacterized protein n=1 Tax=Panaeolus cyanescens TaxID=181874 RepID=A0A409WMP2_9AGAR|nr:hypothetical protein CVT24_010111 [Panaeolus cyanescens]
MLNFKAIPSPNRLSVLQFIAYTSFASYIISQAHVLAHPKSNRGPIPYSPNNAFVFIFFAFSAVLNASWLRQCCIAKWKSNYHQTSAIFVPTYRDMESSGLSFEEKSSRRAHIHFEFDYYDGLSTQSECLPYYIIGNVLLTAWTITYHFEQYEAALFVIRELILPASSSIKLINKISGSAGPANCRTAQYYRIFHASATQTVASGPDPTLGLCLLYDLIALLYGRTDSILWYRTFLCTIAAVATILLVDVHLSSQDGWLYSQAQAVEEHEHHERFLNPMDKQEFTWDILFSSLID